jgi:hypothetical protein
VEVVVCRESMIGGGGNKAREQTESRGKVELAVFMFLFVGHKECEDSQAVGMRA